MTQTHTYGSTEQASQTSEQAKDTAQQVKETAQEKAQQAKGQAESKFREQVDQRSTQAGQQVRSAAGDARSVAEELRRQGKEQPAKLAEKTAERAERLGSYLEESSADRILRDVEDLGRRRPWAIVAGGMALGVVASRFLKASSRRRYQESLGDRRPTMPARAGSPQLPGDGTGMGGL
jgi:hypothetical protein